MDAGFKSGEQLAHSSKPGAALEAAAAFRRVADEFPRSPRAPLALANAAVLLAGGGRPEEAVALDEALVARYPSASEAPAAAWAAARLYEEAALWGPAAKDYELLAARWPGDAHAA